MLRKAAALSSKYPGKLKDAGKLATLKFNVPKITRTPDIDCLDTQENKTHEDKDKDDEECRGTTLKSRAADMDNAMELINNFINSTIFKERSVAKADNSEQKPASNDPVDLKIWHQNGELVLNSNFGISPYDFYNKSSRNGNGNNNNINTINNDAVFNKRLSVTKLLVNSWCELRSFFEIYKGTRRKKTLAMRRGSSSHQALEDESHPIDQTFAERTKSIIPEKLTKEDTYANEIVGYINKLVSLFVHGEAREIKVNAFANRSTSRFLTTEEYQKYNPFKTLSNSGDRHDLILVSGIVDHLYFKAWDGQANFDSFNDNLSVSPSFEPYSNATEGLVNLQDTTSFGRLLKAISERQAIETRHNGQIMSKLIVADVKTRQQPRIPAQENVLNGAKMQVMMYRRMLELLSTSATAATTATANPGSNFTYDTLLESAKQYGYDVDKPITPGFAIVLAEASHIMIPDYFRLLKGKFAINGDGTANENSNSNGCDKEPLLVPCTADYNVTVVNVDALQSDYKDYANLTKVWQQPLTLRYFLYRYAQLLQQLYPFWSNELRVDYYFRDSMFESLEFDYDQHFLQQNNEVEAGGKNKNENEDMDENNGFEKLSFDFWLGKRAPQPINPSFRNFKMYCSFCDFKDECDWHKLGIKHSNELKYRN